MHLVAEIIFIFLIVYLTGSSSTFFPAPPFFISRYRKSCRWQIFPYFAAFNFWIVSIR